MRAAKIIAPLIAAGALSLSPAFAQTKGAGSGYSAGDLLSPCQEADNDARWGETAELECEQYIMGFVSALNATGTGKTMGICPPEVNTADEVRWAFMRWVHGAYSKNTAMDAGKALMATLKESFPCK